MADNEDTKIVDRLNDWLLERCRSSLKKVSRYAGGRSKSTTAVWMSVANYLPRDDFTDMVRFTPWAEPLRVQLFMRSENEMLFTDKLRR